MFLPKGGPITVDSLARLDEVQSVAESQLEPTQFALSADVCKVAEVEVVTFIPAYPETNSSSGLLIVEVISGTCIRQISLPDHVRSRNPQWRTKRPPMWSKNPTATSGLLDQPSANPVRRRAVRGSAEERAGRGTFS